MARRKDRTIGEKMDSKERKVDKSKRIKHTTWAHGDDTWTVMCARQTYDLNHACACKSTRKCDVWGVLFTPPVGCSRLLSAVNDLTTSKKNIAECHFWAALWRNCTQRVSPFFMLLFHELRCAWLFMNFLWAPPGIVPLPPRCAGWRGRRMPFLVLTGRNRCESLFSRLTVKTVQFC